MATIIVGIIVAVIVAAAAWQYIRQLKRGGCGCGCADCPKTAKKCKK